MCARGVQKNSILMPTYTKSPDDEKRASEWVRERYCLSFAQNAHSNILYMIKFSHKILVSVLCLLACLLAYSMRIEWWDFFYFVLFTTLFFAWRSVVRTYARRKDILKLNITTTMATTTTTMQWHQNDTIGTLLFAIDVCTHKIHTTPARVLSITYSHKNCKKLTQKTFDNKYSSTLFVKPPPSNFLLLLRVFLMLIRKGQKIYIFFRRDALFLWEAAAAYIRTHVLAS